ncbi:MAG: transposase [Planctomycetota bacterium]|nr:transposase [Planctomycetota bacterium]
MAVVELELDIPERIRVRGCERIEDGHALEVEWDHPIEIGYGHKVQVIRDLDIQGKPAFFVYQPPYHRCRCGRRQWLIPPFKRKHTTVTLRFEEHVLWSLIASTEEDVARRLGISAEMVRQIINHQLKDERHIDPDRVITDVGYDEISLKKRHKLYVTILTDLTDPEHPRILAVEQGRDQAAAEKCLNRLSPEQREQIRTHRTDMSGSYIAAGKALLPNSQNVTDRFHVAQKLGQVVDSVRKKNSSLQADFEHGGAEAIPFANVGVSQASPIAERPRTSRAAKLV